MPQLPSGRHVAVDPAPLNQLIDDVIHERTIAHWPLLAISTPNDCIAHFEIVYLKSLGDGDEVNLAKGSLPMDARLHKVPTGLKLADVLAEGSDWSRADKAAFCEFLGSNRMQEFAAEHLAQVQKVQMALRKDGNFLQKWQAYTWQTSCHPLQDKE